MHKMSFEWDPEKDIENQKLHEVAFELAQYAFADPDRVIAEDLAHSQDEQRFFCFASVGERIITVRFTVRGTNIRIFGAGYWRKGKKTYEENI